MMEDLLSLSALSMNDEESTDIVELDKFKEAALSCYSKETRNMVTSIIDDLVCETIFKVHMEVHTGVADVAQFDCQPSVSPLNDTFSHMAQELNIIKGNQDIECPKCFAPVKCQWLSKHLAVCMNPDQSTYSYSSRNSSRIARQRIQEGFKTTYDESKNDSDEERIKPKKRNNKGRKTKVNKGK